MQWCGQRAWGTAVERDGLCGNGDGRDRSDPLAGGPGECSGDGPLVVGSVGVGVDLEGPAGSGAGELSRDLRGRAEVVEHVDAGDDRLADREGGVEVATEHCRLRGPRSEALAEDRQRVV